MPDVAQGQMQQGDTMNNNNNSKSLAKRLTKGLTKRLSKPALQKSPNVCKSDSTSALQSSYSATSRKESVPRSQSFSLNSSPNTAALPKSGTFSPSSHAISEVASPYNSQRLLPLTPNGINSPGKTNDNGYDPKYGHADSPVSTRLQDGPAEKDTVERIPNEIQEGQDSSHSPSVSQNNGYTTDGQNSESRNSNTTSDSPADISQPIKSIDTGQKCAAPAQATGLQRTDTPSNSAASSKVVRNDSKDSRAVKSSPNTPKTADGSTSLSSLDNASSSPRDSIGGKSGYNPPTQDAGVTTATRGEDCSEGSSSKAHHRGEPLQENTSSQEAHTRAGTPNNPEVSTPKSTQSSQPLNTPQQGNEYTSIISKHNREVNKDTVKTRDLTLAERQESLAKTHAARTPSLQRNTPSQTPNGSGNQGKGPGRTKGGSTIETLVKAIHTPDHTAYEINRSETMPNVRSPGGLFNTVDAVDARKRADSSSPVRPERKKHMHATEPKTSSLPREQTAMPRSANNSPQCHAQQTKTSLSANNSPLHISSPHMSSRGAKGDTYGSKPYIPVTRGYPETDQRPTTPSTEENPIFETIQKLETAKQPVKNSCERETIVPSTREETSANSTQHTPNISSNHCPSAAEANDRAVTRSEKQNGGRRSTSPAVQGSRRPSTKSGQYSPMAQSLMRSPSLESLPRLLPKIQSLTRVASLQKFFPDQILEAPLSDPLQHPPAIQTAPPQTSQTADPTPSKLERHDKEKQNAKELRRPDDMRHHTKETQHKLDNHSQQDNHSLASRGSQIKTQPISAKNTPKPTNKEHHSSKQVSNKVHSQQHPGAGSMVHAHAQESSDVRHRPRHPSGTKEHPTPRHSATTHRPQRRPPSSLNISSLVDEMLSKENPLPLYDGDPYLNAAERQNQTALPSRMGSSHTASMASSQVTVAAFKPKHLLEKAMPLGVTNHGEDVHHYELAPSYATSEMSIGFTDRSLTDSQLSVPDSLGSVSTPVKAMLHGNFLQCNICYEGYIRPKLLACLHTFCQDCIDRVTLGDHEDRIFVCPLCDCHLSMPPAGAIDLPDDDFILTLVRETDRNTRHELEETKRCILCVAQNIAEASCLDCKGFICIECMKVHNHIKMFVDHTVVTFDYLAATRQTIIDEITNTMECMKNTCSILKSGIDIVQNYIASVQKKEKETMDAIDKRAELLIANISNSATTMKKQVAENTQMRIGDMQFLLDDCHRQLGAVSVVRQQLDALKSFRTRDLDPYRCVRGQVMRLVPRVNETCTRVKNMQYPTVKHAQFVRGEFIHWPTVANALLGFLVPLSDRRERRVEVYDTKGLFEQPSMAEYTVSCCHEAIDKYAHQPRNNLTYAYVAAFVTHQLHIELPGHEFHCIVGNNYNFSISKGDCIVVVIDDFDITVYTNSKKNFAQHRVTPEQSPYWLTSKSINNINEAV